MKHGGPYRVVDIQRGCTCQSYLDDLKRRDKELAPASEHLHITCVKPEDEKGREQYWLNRYLEEKGRVRSVDTDDEIYVVGKAKGQLALF